MAAETTAKALGYKAPDFELLDTVSGTMKSLDELKGKVATVVMFICNHCPYVVHVNRELVAVANDYMDKGIGFIAISSNDVVRYPQDSPENMKKLAKAMDYPFPYLYDETQEVAKAYAASCTPDFSVFDAELSCVYRGRLDGSNPKNDVVTDGRDLRTVLDAILAGEGVPEEQQPSVGCSIKWFEG